ncbi:hypothetical protein GCM10010123_01880 [Pilimelia anulata]|uniref:5'-3' exonuclease n=1 Tax=Pilimelia anulata TaxID=53371 RepID=A0A8J3F755_9ACTN|nr:5'-3' exonuclease H3TH domain-containing protein [Pilimelia anulata]GGJ75534.1 hypothetical protein GCM10010123_01880 [Pilimelia anulata]
MGGVQSPSADVPFLLVDGHNLLWRAALGFPAEIRSRDRARVLTGLFGFFALLRVAIRDEIDGDPEVLVVFDGQHGNSGRLSVDAGYKAQRPTGAAALTPITYLPSVKDGLNRHHIPWIELDQVEADDVIATLTAGNPDRETLIMSADRDYYQLINDRIRVLNTAMRSGGRHIDATAVHTRYRVWPRQWPDFRALVGDPADNIRGIRGIGAGTAAMLLVDGLTLDALPASGRLEHGRGRLVAADYELACKYRDMIRLNTAVDLTYQPTGRSALPLPAPRDIVETLGLW